MGLKDKYPNYEDLPENVRWIVDRLDELESLQKLVVDPNTKAAADEFWKDMLNEYKAKFNGDLVEDLLKFAERDMK